MARLISDIGIELRKHTANARKAKVYRQMAAAIMMEDETTIAALPKYVPRGHAPAWYLERADKAEQVSHTAGDMADLLHNMEQRNRWEAMTPEEVWADLVEGRGFPGMAWRHEGWIEFLGFLIHEKLEQLPYLVPKLSPEQREYCRGRIRAMLGDLIEAFR
jgi:hypothetical protein